MCILKGIMTGMVLTMYVLFYGYFTVFFVCCQLSLVDVDQALFQPYPSELVFQNFTPAQTYKLPLLLFNKDKVCE